MRCVYIEVSAETLPFLESSIIYRYRKAVNCFLCVSPRIKNLSICSFEIKMVKVSRKHKIYLIDFGEIYCGNKTGNPVRVVSLHLAFSGGQSQCRIWLVGIHGIVAVMIHFDGST